MRLADLRLQLLDAGWHPLPVQGKRPVVTDWTHFCETAPTEAEITMWDRVFPHAASTGIACGMVVGIDIDVVSDPVLAHEIRAAAISIFGYILQLVRRGGPAGGLPGGTSASPLPCLPARAGAERG